MADVEDREKADKLAAAKKRVEQLKKQRAKKAEKEKEKQETGFARPVKEDVKEEEDLSTLDYGAESSRADGDNGNSLAGQADDAGVAKSEQQPSFTIQSRMRSDSIGRSATDNPLGFPALRSTLVNGDREVQKVHKNQVARGESPDKDSKTFAEEVVEPAEALQKSELHAENMELAQREIAVLRAKLAYAETTSSEVESLKAEISSLQRQNAGLHAAAASQKRRTSSSAMGITSTDDLASQLAVKTGTIDLLEVEVSNLRHALSISNTELEDFCKNAKLETETARTELETLKASLLTPLNSSDSASLSAESERRRILLLQSDLSAAHLSADAAIQRAAALEKKVEAITTLHREAERRYQSQSNARLKELHEARNELAEMRKNLTAVSNRNALLREVDLTMKTSTVESDSDVPNHEDEGRVRLQTQVRALQAEVSDLKRGIWKERRTELQPELRAVGTMNGDSFDDVDLSVTSPPNRKFGFASPYDTFSSVVNAFTDAVIGGQPQSELQSQRKGQNGFLEDDDIFDEEAFRLAQEEEATTRLERVREVKKSLLQWQGYRVNLVDVRGGAMAGVFDV